MIENMGKIANEQGISFNQLVIQCCEFALKHLQTDKE
jgi:predicted HicB family RNase H-like nuclease